VLVVVSVCGHVVVILLYFCVFVCVCVCVGECERVSQCASRSHNMASVSHRDPRERRKSDKSKETPNHREPDSERRVQETNAIISNIYTHTHAHTKEATN
jgi:hypothetical protein